MHRTVQSNNQWQGRDSQAASTWRTVLARRTQGVSRMRYRITGSLIVAALVSTLTMSGAVMAQAPQRGAAAPRNATPPASPAHDPHDLSGVWLQRGGGTNRNPESQWS